MCVLLTSFAVFPFSENHTQSKCKMPISVNERFEIPANHKFCVTPDLNEEFVSYFSTFVFK